MALIPLRNSTSHSLNCIKSESEPQLDAKIAPEGVIIAREFTVIVRQPRLELYDKLKGQSDEQP
jgi:hypothetical protein